MKLLLLMLYFIDGKIFQNRSWGLTEHEQDFILIDRMAGAEAKTDTHTVSCKSCQKCRGCTGGNCMRDCIRCAKSCL